MNLHATMPLAFEALPEAEMQARAEAFLAVMRKRRTCATIPTGRCRAR